MVKAKRKSRIKAAWDGLWAGFWTPLGGSGNRGAANSPSMGGGTYDVYNSQPEPSTPELIKAFEDTVFSCVNLISNQMSQVTWKLCVTTSPGDNRPKSKTKKLYSIERVRIEKENKQFCRKARDVQEVLDYPLLDILDRPNAHQSFHQLIAWTQSYVDICGSAFWYLSRRHFAGLSELAEIWLLPSDKITINRDEDGRLINYTNNLGNEPEDLDPEDVLHIHSFNPADLYNGFGIPPLRAVWQRVQLLRQEQTSWQSVLANMAVPGGLVSPPDGEVWTDQQAQRMGRQLSERFRFGNQGGVWVVQDSIKYNTPTPPPANLSALSLFDQIRQSICNAYSVPVEMLDLKDQALQASETSRRNFQEYCLRPRVHNIFSAVSHRLCPPRMFLCADQIVQPDSTFELQRITNLLQGNVIKVNEARVAQGFPADPGMDKYLYQITSPGGVGTLPNLTGVPKSKGFRAQSTVPDPAPLHQALVEVFGRLKADALGKLKAAPAVHTKTFIPMDQWSNEITDVVNPVLRIYFEEGSEGIFGELGMRLRRLPVLELDRAVNRASLQLADSTLSTTDLQVSDAIAQVREAIRGGLSEGEANAQLSNRIEAIFTDLETRRAYLIAETESARAKHQGELLAIEDAGVEVQKVWLADSMACPICSKLDGSQKELNEPFAVVGNGPYDTWDHPPGHPGCRCSLQYDLMEDNEI